MFIIFHAALFQLDVQVTKSAQPMYALLLQIHHALVFHALYLLPAKVVFASLFQITVLCQVNVHLDMLVLPIVVY